MISFSSTYSYVTKTLLRVTEPNKLRDYLKSEINKNYKYLTYPNSKKILHNEIGDIDIYGDGSLEKNVEHIYPQSKFKNKEKRTMMRSDLHNLYLCNTKLNNIRQNFKYMDTKELNIDDDIKILDMKGKEIINKNEIFKKFGYIMGTNNKKKIFIPTNYSRGKIARSLSYFTIKYDFLNELNDIINIKTLIEWNLKDPVDNDEYLKNIKVYKHQGNLNPFILEPDLVHYCFSDKIEITEEILSKKRQSSINHLYSINYLVNEIKELEREKKERDIIINKLSNTSKK